MQVVDQEIQKLVSGGKKHYHWECNTNHSYYSVPRNLGSAKAWAARHNTKYHNGKKRATYSSCLASCGEIRTNYPT